MLCKYLPYAFFLINIKNVIEMTTIYEKLYMYSYQWLSYTIPVFYTVWILFTAHRKSKSQIFSVVSFR